jgi:ABC-type polysaccharide/polyol phosphate transport system ATPase subunit
MQSSLILDQVSKRYRIGTGLTNFRDLFTDRNKRANVNYHWAVKDVNFELKPGEAMGIIGPNGAGKTTLLKLLSQVTKPTSGRIQVNGRLSALIELGAGFHPDLPGRDNIFLNGTILGMRSSDIRSRFDAIVDFAGIGKYLDTPVKRYSSGMYARLGFAIAAHVDPQILLVDEVLAVGDYAFQQKCYARMDELRSQGTSLILVSHNMEAIRRVCDRGLVMYRGEDIYAGSAAEAVVAYSNALRESARKSAVEMPKENGISERVMTFDAEITRVRLFAKEDDIPVSMLQSGDSARVVLDIHFNKDVHAPIVSLTINTPDGRVVYDTMTSWMNVPMPDFVGGENAQIEFILSLPLLEGTYEIDVTIVAADLSHFYDYAERAMGFSITDTTGAKGVVDLDAQVSITRSSVEVK